MLKYGTDKPDLRNPIELTDVTNIFSSKDVKNGQVIVLALMFSFVMVICLLLNKF